MITLKLGDCLEVMKDIPDKSVDMVFADIPYGEVNKYAKKVGGIRNLDKGDADEITFELRPFLNHLTRICKGSFYVFCGSEQVSSIRQILGETLSTRHCIWEKTNPSPMNGQYTWLSSIENCVFAKNAGSTFNEHCKSAVWRFPNGQSKVHPTQKPTALVEYLIKSSSNPGDLILDPCMGSGTTGVASIMTRRKFVGIELNPEYFKIAKQRIEEAEKIIAEGDRQLEFPA